MKKASIAVISAVNEAQQKVIAVLQPSEKETGWINCAVEVKPWLVGRECMVVPSEDSYAQALAVPVHLDFYLLEEIKKLKERVTKLEGFH